MASAGLSQRLWRCSRIGALDSRYCRYGCSLVPARVLGSLCIASNLEAGSRFVSLTQSSSKANFPRAARFSSLLFPIHHGDAIDNADEFVSMQLDQVSVFSCHRLLQRHSHYTDGVEPVRLPSPFITITDDMNLSQAILLQRGFDCLWVTSTISYKSWHDFFRPWSICMVMTPLVFPQGSGVKSSIVRLPASHTSALFGVD